MDKEFWHKRWQDNEIGFHNNETHPLLDSNIKQLSLKNNSRIFLPLCGKSLDMIFLHNLGLHVLGIELSELAVKQFFHDLNIEPEVYQHNDITRYQVDHLDIFCGDFFALDKEILGKVDAVYDRAALVALPEEMRRSYTSHLIKLTQSAPQLLLTIQYDIEQISGPPFVVPDNEVSMHYQDCYQIQKLETMTMSDKLKGKCIAQETIWHLT